MIGLFLLPLFSVVSITLQFYEIYWMIIVFICLCSCYWNKLKEKKLWMNQQLTPYLSDTEVNSTNQHGLSYEEIRDCLTKVILSNAWKTFSYKSTNLTKKWRWKRSIVSRRKKCWNWRRTDFGMVPWCILWYLF